MLPQEIIRRKRDKQELSGEQIREFIRGVTEGKIDDIQTAALTMAIFLNGTIYRIQLNNSGHDKT